MPDKEAAAAAKAKGNAALSAKNFEEAVAAYTEAIGHDPGDKVFYSNRSAAYASMGKWQEALDDGQKCVEVDPTFAKGYGRAGAGFFGLGKYQEAVDIYKKGLEIDSGNAMLQQGLASAQQKLEAASNPIAGLFSDPASLQRLATNPQTAGFLSQPDFMQKLQQIAQNPQMMQMHMTDPRIQTALGVMLGMPGAGPGGGAAGGAQAPDAAAQQEAPEVKSAAEEEREREKAAPPVELTEEEKARLEVVEKAEAVKAKGTAAFKEAGKLKKDPEAKAGKVKEALAFFTEASEIDDTNMLYLSNRAACMFELKQFDECIAECKKAVELGRQHRSDFKNIAKAFARIGNCQVEQGDLAAALESYDQSLMENHDDKVYQKKQKNQEEEESC